MLINGYKPEFQSTKRSKDAKFGQFFISPHPRRTDAQNGLQSIFNITELLYDKLPKPNCQLCLTGGGGGGGVSSSILLWETHFAVYQPIYRDYQFKIQLRNSWVSRDVTISLGVNQFKIQFRNSWVSRDVTISLGVNSKSMHSHRREIVFHCLC